MIKFLDKIIRIGVYMFVFSLISCIKVSRAMEAGEDNDKAIIPHQGTTTVVPSRNESNLASGSTINIGQNRPRDLAADVPFTANPGILKKEDRDFKSLLKKQQMIWFGDPGLLSLPTDRLDDSKPISLYVMASKFFFGDETIKRLNLTDENLILYFKNLMKDIPNVQNKKDLGLTMLYHPSFLLENERQFIINYFERQNLKVLCYLSLRCPDYEKIIDLIENKKEKGFNGFDLKLVAPESQTMSQHQLQNEHIIKLLQEQLPNKKIFLIIQMLSEGICEEVDSMFTENDKQKRIIYRVKNYLYSVDDSSDQRRQKYKELFIEPHGLLEKTIIAELLEKTIINDFSGKEKINICYGILDSNLFDDFDKQMLMLYSSQLVKSKIKMFTFKDENDKNHFDEKIKFCFKREKLTDKEKIILEFFISKIKELSSKQDVFQIFFELNTRGVFEILIQ